MDETICSLGRLIALASSGAVKRASKESVFVVETETDLGLKTCGLCVVLAGKEVLGGDEMGGLAVAEALKAIAIMLWPLANSQLVTTNLIRERKRI